MGTGLRILDTDWTTGQGIGAAIDVHCYLGPGMLEHAYEVAARLAPVHTSQVLTYLRFAELHVGLLFNFDVDALAAGGWKRILRRA